MQNVLLRIWPKPVRAGVVGLERLVAVGDNDLMMNDGDIFHLDELGWDLPIEKRSDDAPEGAAFALHFLASPREVLSLASKGWKPIQALCPSCPRL